MTVNRILERIEQLENNLEYYERVNAEFEAQETRRLIEQEEDLLVIFNRPEWRGRNQTIFQRYFLEFMPAIEYSFNFGYIFEHLSAIYNEEKYQQLYYDVYKNEEGVRQ